MMFFLFLYYSIIKYDFEEDVQLQSADNLMFINL